MTGGLFAFLFVYLNLHRWHFLPEGYLSRRSVKIYQRLVPKLYDHLNPMPYAMAVRMEVDLAESLRKRGYIVYGGH